MKKTLRITIVKCSDPSMWYAGHIGKEFICYDVTDFEYVTRQPVEKEGDYPYLNVVLKEDAAIVINKGELHVLET